MINSFMVIAKSPNKIKYIYETSNNGLKTYHVRKSSGSHYKRNLQSIDYGRYFKQEEAQRVVTELIKCNWKKEELPGIWEKLNIPYKFREEHISKYGDDNKSFFKVFTLHNGKRVNYGHYKNYEEALTVAKTLEEKKNWKCDYDELSNLLNELGIENIQTFNDSMMSKSNFMLINQKILDNFFTERNIAESTRKSYCGALKRYSECVNENNLQKIIDKALKQEDNHVPMRKRTIKKNILKFRTWLLDKGVRTRTAHTYESSVLTFHRHYGVEIPFLPQTKMKNDKQVDYFDLPDKDMIRTAIRQADKRLGSLICFMASSGTAKAEALDLTVGRFLDGCKEYYTPTDDLYNDILRLSKVPKVVPLISMHRIKTDKFYYTCCSYEASKLIFEYLLSRDNLSLEDNLWDISNSKLLFDFQEINDRNNWGRVGPYRRFRSHMLRKFHASNIRLPADQIDMFQGRAKNAVHETYIKQNPATIKDLYLTVMDNVLLFKDEEDMINNEIGENVTSDVDKEDDKLDSSTSDEGIIEESVDENYEDITKCDDNETGIEDTECNNDCVEVVSTDVHTDYETTNIKTSTGGGGNQVITLNLNIPESVDLNLNLNIPNTSKIKTNYKQ